jgi:ABC-type uncharacterized transport system auxiliary subunit
MRLRFAACVAALTLAGCAATPVPEKYFYRLPEAHPEKLKTPLARTAISIERLASSAQHNERAILFSEDAAGTRLQQHHYDFWVETPPLLVQDFLITWLRSAGAAPQVLPDDLAGSAELRVLGFVRRFEILRGAAPAVAVSVELRAQRRDGKGLLLVRDYSDTEPLSGGALAAAPGAFSAALGRIAARFSSDLTAVMTAAK